MAATGPRKVRTMTTASAKVQAINEKSENPTNAAAMPADAVKQLRTLAHDLSNSIETIMQASYLLNQGSLDDANHKWAGLIDQAARDAAQINRKIRDILRAISEPAK
jgi:signal transduction histidine kinase